jgi:hypothetical protein
MDKYGVCPDCGKRRKYISKKQNRCMKCAMIKLHRNKKPRKILACIDVKKTEKVYGYNPQYLFHKSGKKVIIVCDCGIERHISMCKAHTKCRSCAANARYRSNHPKKVSSCISIAKTIEIFGYNPRYISAHSTKRVVVVCKNCKKERYISKAEAMSNPLCKSCAATGKNNSMYGISIKGKNSPRYGKTALHGKRCWYTQSNGKRVCFRSTWELATAKFLDNRGILWKYEPKAFPIIYEYENETKEGTYIPDFHLLNKNVFYEIKGWFWNKARSKFDAFISQYPRIKIELLMKPELKAMGIL